MQTHRVKISENIKQTRSFVHAKRKKKIIEQIKKKKKDIQTEENTIVGN